MLRAPKSARVCVPDSRPSRVVLMARWARRIEQSVWSLLVSLLWPAVFMLIAAIAGIVGWALLAPAAGFQSSLVLSLLLVLFALVMVTVLLGADAESRR